MVAYPPNSGGMTTTAPEETAAAIVEAGRRLAAHRGIAISTLGREAIGSSRFFEDLKAGRVTFRRAARLVARLSAMWPENLDWPDAIKRPNNVLNNQERSRGSA